MDSIEGHIPRPMEEVGVGALSLSHLCITLKSLFYLTCFDLELHYLDSNHDLFELRMFIFHCGEQSSPSFF